MKQNPFYNPTLAEEVADLDCGGGNVVTSKHLPVGQNEIKMKITAIFVLSLAAYAFIQLFL